MRVHVCVDCLCVCACIRACVHMQALRKKEEADHQEHLASATHASLLGSVRVPAAAATAGYAPVGHGGGGGAPPGGQQGAYAADVGACADAALRGSVGVGGLVDSYISRFESEPARAAFVVDVTDKMHTWLHRRHPVRRLRHAVSVRRLRHAVSVRRLRHVVSVRRLRLEVHCSKCVRVHFAKRTVR